MTKSSNRNAFFRQIEVLRKAKHERAEPAEIARLALKAGLQPHEALQQIRNYFEHQYTRSTDLSEALALFVSSLCDHRTSDAILEYTSWPFLLTARVAETDSTGLWVVAANKQFAETLRLLFAGKGTAIFDSVASFSSEVTYGTIVCMPPLGDSRSDDAAFDGFGGEIIRKLVPFLSKEGTIYWITGRGVLIKQRAKRTLTDLEALGLHLVGCIETAPRVFPGTPIEGLILIHQRKAPKKRFVARLRDIETAEPTARAFLSGPTRNEGPTWAWLDSDDSRLFSNVEMSRLLQKLAPRGRYRMQPLGTLLHTEKVQKADRPISDQEQPAAFLYIPEYAGSRVTATLDEQTVKPNAVYRLSIDPQKANPRFLAQILNGPYGRQIRGNVASGATIQRVAVPTLMDLQLPIPDAATQDRIARFDSDIGLLLSAFQDMQNALEQDWTSLSDIGAKIDNLKEILDIERQIANWWRELPYPLATIYRRYQVSTEPRARLDALLHFFEMAAIYLAAVGTSHVKVLREDWQGVLGQWLHPSGGAAIERADFGFWINLAAASLKDLSRISRDKELRSQADEIAGPELVQLAGTISRLSRATEALDVARRYRNSWIGHGGHMKPSDATRLDGELQQSIRAFYEIAASIFRQLKLVRTGMAEVTENGFKFQIEKLVGSDPTFEQQQVDLARPIKSNALAFWMSGARTMCHALPFFRLGLPQRPQETSFYVFNRIEKGGIRWISYQETLEQEFIAPDDELLGIIALGRAH